VLYSFDEKKMKIMIVKFEFSVKFENDLKLLDMERYSKLIIFYKQKIERSIQTINVKIFQLDLMK